MNANKTNSKRLAALLMVLVVCAASLVTIAYAYNATYSTHVDEQPIDVISESRYLTIESDNTGYDSSIDITLESTYDTVTTSGTADSTKYVRSAYVATIKSDNCTLKDGILSVKVADLTISNKGNSAQTVDLTVDKAAASSLASGKIPAFEQYNLLGPGDFQFRTGSNTVSSTEISANSQAKVELWVSGSLNQNIVPKETAEEPKGYDGSYEYQIWLPAFDPLVIKASTSDTTIDVAKGAIVSKTIADVNGTVTVEFAAPADDKYTIVGDSNNGTYSLTVNDTTYSILSGLSVSAENTETDLSSTDATLTYILDSGLVSDGKLAGSVSLFHQSSSTKTINLTLADGELDSAGEYTLTENSDGTYSLKVFVKGFSSYYLTTTADSKLIATGDSGTAISYVTLKDVLGANNTTSGEIIILRDMALTKSDYTVTSGLNAHYYGLVANSLTVDGQGRTVTGPGVEGDTGSLDTIFRVNVPKNTTASVCFKNMILKGTDDNTSGTVGITIGNESNGDPTGPTELTVENVTFTGFRAKALVASYGTNFSSATVKGCTFDNSVAYYSNNALALHTQGGDYALQFRLNVGCSTSSAEIVIEDCVFTGINGKDSAIAINDIDNGRSISSVEIRNCSFSKTGGSEKGDIVIGRSNDANGTAQDFPMTVTSKGETAVLYRGSQNDDVGNANGPLKIVLENGAVLNTAVSEDISSPSITITLTSGTAAASGVTKSCETVKYAEGTTFSGFEAAIGDVLYFTLEEANDAAVSGSTISLKSDAELEKEFNIAKDLVIDGNNYTVTSSAKKAFTISGAVSVTLQNFTLVSKYTMTENDVDGSYGVQGGPFKASGVSPKNITVSNVTFKGFDSKQIYIGGAENITVSGCVFNGSETKLYHGWIESSNSQDIWGGDFGVQVRNFTKGAQISIKNNTFQGSNGMLSQIMVNHNVTDDSDSKSSVTISGNKFDSTPYLGNISIGKSTNFVNTAEKQLAAQSFGTVNITSAQDNTQVVYRGADSMEAENNDTGYNNAAYGWDEKPLKITLDNGQSITVTYADSKLKFTSSIGSFTSIINWPDDALMKDSYTLSSNVSIVLDPSDTSEDDDEDDSEPI